VLNLVPKFMTTNPPLINTRPTPSIRLSTDRLVLRPTKPSDAVRAFEIQSDWDVTRMLRMARFPPSLNETAGWFAEHEAEWLSGTAYRFAIECQDRMIGAVDVDEINNREGELGYWIEKSSWGKGYAFEAAQAAVDFAFNEVGLVTLRSGHAVDNPVSGKVLVKLGFRAEEVTEKASRSRCEDILHQHYSLGSAAWATRPPPT